MQDDNNYVSLLQVHRRWSKRFSWVFIVLIVLFTGLVLVFPDFINNFNNKWLHSISVLMTLIIGYTFIIGRFFDLIAEGGKKEANKKSTAEQREFIKELRALRNLPPDMEELIKEWEKKWGLEELNFDP